MLYKPSTIFVGVFCCLLLGAACSNNPFDKKNKSPQKDGASPEVGDLITVGVSVTQKGGSGLSLQEAASSYALSVTGCASGRVIDPPVTSPAVSLYKGDENCVAKLVALTVNNVTYSAPASANFQKDALIVYTSSNSTIPAMIVRVVSQLSSPLAMTDTIAFEFKQSFKGETSSFGENDVSNSIPVTVLGDRAPRFTIKTYAFDGIGAGGAGKFTFKLQCDVPLVGADAASVKCDGLSLVSDIRYLLVKDNSGGTNNLSFAEADALFAPDKGTTITAASVRLPTDTDTAWAGKGGFVTSGLLGPGKLTASGNNNMILVLKAGPSYTYFNVDVTLLGLTE